jgi:hypothetical protein
MDFVMKTYLGIDPGKGSFICTIADDIVSFDKIPMIGTETDLKALNEIFSSYQIGFPKDNIHAVLEDVHSIFGSSAKSNWEFGKINGMLEALLVANGIPYTKVQPKRWQKQMWEGIPIQTNADGKTDTKATSLLAAQRLYPMVDLRKSERAKKPDHNKVDALLIAEYCRRNF